MRLVYIAVTAESVRSIASQLPSLSSIIIQFLPRDAMRKCGLSCRPVSVCSSRWCIESTRLKIL